MGEKRLFGCRKVIPTDGSLHRESRGLLLLKMLGLGQTPLPCSSVTPPLPSFQSHQSSPWPEAGGGDAHFFPQAHRKHRPHLLCFLHHFRHPGCAGRVVTAQQTAPIPTTGIKQPLCPHPYHGHLYPQVQTQGTEQSRRDRQARKLSAAALFHELSPMVMSLQPLAKIARCSASAVIAGCARQELTLTPGRSWIRDWVSVTGRVQGWHSTRLAGHVHATPQEQAAQHLLARTLPPVSSVSPPRSEPQIHPQPSFIFFLFNPLYFWLLHRRGARVWALLPSQGMRYT